ncbi:hypothetical protein [Paenibacillus sp. PAMC21692]|uniref:hypothetical protein n=1 Tax=Paenibacillus sp. PAMC21692 TaxID=2762320 RepID=UPI00164E3C6A|nr:hypothetical protein [Paenibacillus sp. PAMC21692]QNK55318.1 hypothetical protein H7F31_22225 [Paenibacillus sp. PAMC21692]
MSQVKQIKPEQPIVTDKEFELAIKEKTLVNIFQNDMQIRPVATISGYSPDTIRMSDGSVIHRNANSFFAAANKAR